VIDLDRYAILGVLGRGPRGVVYKARDHLANGLVALKAIDPLPDWEARLTLETAWFVNDALDAWRLMHPNIVTVYDAGDAGGKIYVAMELLKGYSLRRELDVDRSLGMLRSIRIVAETACGLAYAHEQGVVHRNLKPANIFIRGDAEVRITDFGVARMGDSDILSGKYARCLSYMSPERICGDEPIDGRSDIFSLGAVLYEMLTRTLPFPGSTPAEIVGKVLMVEPPLPSELNPDVPPWLDGMVSTMLAKDPHDRPADVGIVLRDLQRLEEEFSERPVATANSAERVAVTKGAPLTASARTSTDHSEMRLLTHGPGTGIRERRRLTSILLAGAFATATGLGVLWWHLSDSPEAQALAISAEPASGTLHRRGSPAAEYVANDGPISLAASREPPAPAQATVSPTTLESGPSVAALAIVAEAKIAPHSTVTQVRSPRGKPSGGPPRKTATLTFAVSPWGAVYIDSKFHGTTPPVTTLDLSPGRHLVEVRNSSQPAYLTYATVRAGENRSIRHEFETGHELR
jgi:serine/threonine-protein kinase